MEDKNKSIRINVNAGEGNSTVFLGTPAVQLEDTTQQTYQTNNLKEFTDFLVARASDQNLRIFFDESSCTAFPRDISHDSRPVAVCTLEKSRTLKVIESKLLNAGSVSIRELEELLTCLKGFADADARELLGYVRDFKIAKITSVVQQKNQKTGDFVYSVKRESAGKGDGVDYEFPESIAFVVPLFQHHVETFVVRMEVMFSYSDREDSVACSFSFKNYTYADELQKSQEEVVRAFLKDLPCPSHWGTNNIAVQDDEWRFKMLPLPQNE